jgi:hypothetical protein
LNGSPIAYHSNNAAPCALDGDGVGIDFVMEECEGLSLGKAGGQLSECLVWEVMVMLVVMLDGDGVDGGSTSCRNLYLSKSSIYQMRSVTIRRLTLHSCLTAS